MSEDNTRANKNEGEALPPLPCSVPRELLEALLDNT